MEAELAALSASSLPGIPTYPGIHARITLQFYEDNIAKRFLITNMRQDLMLLRLEEEILCKTLSESVKIIRSFKFLFFDII